jgi:hypothetical protein
MSKQEYTVEYISNMLKHCSPDALLNIIVQQDDTEVALPITSVIVHKTNDNKELVSLIHTGEKDETV